MSKLHPDLRSSQLGKLNPQGMNEVPMTREQRLTIEGIALGVFTDMVNSGASLQKTLAAIYVTGMQHAKACMEQKDTP